MRLILEILASEPLFTKWEYIPNVVISKRYVLYRLLSIYALHYSEKLEHMFTLVWLISHYTSWTNYLY